MRYRKDLFYLGLLFVLSIFFWWGALLPGKVLFYQDLSVEIVAKRHFFTRTCGVSLWCPYIFFGIPHAANAQSEVFYPFNFLFCVFGAERGLVYYIVFHHIFFVLTLFVALRRLSFSAEASLIGSIAAGFGGYMTSLTLYVVLLSAATWMPLIMICLRESLGKKWLPWGLLLGLALALQFLAGEYEISAMTTLFAFLAVFFSKPGGLRDLVKMSAVLAFGFLWGIVLSLPQIALTWEMIPLSNRSQGMNLNYALYWSVPLSTLKNLVIPNFFLPYSAGLYSSLGRIIYYNFIESFYLGLGLAPLAVFGLFNRQRTRVWPWFIFALFGLAMMLGDNLPVPVYGFLHTHAPAMKFFRIPAKYFFFVNFGFIMLSLYGYEYLGNRKWSVKLLSMLFIIAGLAAAGLLMANPVKVSELSDQYIEVVRYFYMRSIMRASACLFLSLGLVFLVGVLKQNALGTAFALVVFVDLFMAHRYLNPSASRDFYQPNNLIREFKDKEKNRIDPVRMFSLFNSNELVPKTVASRYWRYEKCRDYLDQDWAVYFDLDNLRGESSFYPADIDRYKKVLVHTGWPDSELILARSGVEYTYHPDTGFKKLSRVFDRAMVFYQTKAVPDQRQAIWYLAVLDFPAQQTLILEAKAAEMKSSPELLISEPARIVKYENEKVVIEAEARREGWLLLLDAYYPGWKAEVDGKPVEIYRADGFFRAVKIPAGKHVITFSYFPDIFRNSLYVSGAGFLLWLVLLCAGAMARGRTGK